MSSQYIPCRSLPLYDHRRWYAFLIVSVATPFVLAAPIVLWRLFRFFTRGTHKTSSTATDASKALIGWDARLSLSASRISSDQTALGQLLKFLAVVFCTGSLIIYFRDTAPNCIDVEMCHDWLEDPWWNVDLAFNCYLLIYFILRFMSAQNKLAFLFEIYSVVDYFTIPVTFVAIGLNRNWHGLRYLRIINLLWLVDLLHRFKALKTVAQIQFSRLVVYITIAIIVGAGTFLLLECQGDPWDIDNTLQQNGTFWNYAYFSVVTISTVGYGDLGCKTVLGKLFCCLYIFACLFFIASFIATAASLVPPPKKYPSFDHTQYFDHIIVCGNITHAAVARLLGDLYEDPNVCGLESVYLMLLHPDDPDDEMILLLRNYQACVEFVQGSPFDDACLDEVRARYARSCIILADQHTADPDAEDAKHILEIVAIKNYCPTLRVQIQVVKSSTTGFLKNYPAINSNRGDVIICQENIEMALLGMSCRVPGFSTLFSNLIGTNRPLPASSHIQVPWLYEHGSRMDLHCVQFGNAFLGLTVPQAAELCFKKLNILLIGVYTRGEYSEMEYHDVIPNATSDVTITNRMRGQVVAPTKGHAKSVEILCPNCHADAIQPGLIGPCLCAKDGELSVNALFKDQTQLTHIGNGAYSRTTSRESTNIIKSDIGSGMYDSTGMFHWQTPQSFEKSLLTPEEAKTWLFERHVAILVLPTPTTSSIGLHHLIAPLRTSSVPLDEMSDVVILGSEEQLRREWPTIKMLPKVFMIAGDPTDPTVMPAAQLRNCQAACLLAAGHSISRHDETLIDKDVVILTLRLRGLAYTAEDMPLPRPYFVRGIDVPLISYIDSGSSVRFLSQESSAVDYQLTVPYMSGQVLSSARLDSLLIPACSNPSLLRLCSSLVFGGISLELRRVLSEGIGLQAPTEAHQPGPHLRSTIKLVDLDSDVFQAFANKPYEDLFLYALRDLGILCIGLYRLFTLSLTEEEDRDWKWSSDARYVATNPPGNTLLDITDRLYILLPAQVVQ
ncbi:Calcium-activated potassium channel subunit alpha-1 [Hypsibius exemplaris]|uniref:BK channel n=1 Tax=Hypsibius exemplaris TaxID=2072580 RepID=A0A1W0X719_HYPEX|nr:Calcium-activated potassium channel subunit alpha-1 [Hypsibius exemplaris]